MGEANEAIGQVESSLEPAKWPCCGALFKVQDSRCDDRADSGKWVHEERRRTRPDVLSPVNGERYSGSCWG